MRLIDVDKITTKDICEYLGILYASCAEDIQDLLNDQPTAYDINKVIEELEDLDIYYDNDYFSSKGNSLIDRKDAIEIVKNGLDKME